MKNVWFWLLLLGFFPVAAQHDEHCGTTGRLQQLLQQSPEAQAQLQQFHQTVDAYLQQADQRNDRGIIIRIPVVFHIIHSGQAVGTAQNISEAQIFSQMTVLNRCYRKQNSDTLLVPNVFKGRHADVEVEFCLAQVDPQGNPTNGIKRYNYTNSSNFDNNIKPATQWDPTRYLNIWTTLLGGGILGYATMPGIGPLNQDGVVLDYRYVGAAPANPFSSSYDKGKTAVHEVGHWLGLYHTFEDGCAGNNAATCALLGDRVCDTPPTKDPNYGSPSLTQNTCTETPVDEQDMWMNYMDYVNDANLLMFTTGQKDVMRAVLNTLRLTIQTSTGCTDTNTLYAFSGKVVDEATNQGVASARVLVDGPLSYETTTDANGDFLVNVPAGNYDVYAGKWGYRTKRFAVNEIVYPGMPSVTIPIRNKFYYDDFIMNFNWNVSATATAGFWVRERPIATVNGNDAANPGNDVADDYGARCYVTGNGNGGPDAWDVDNGTVTLTSPVFDLTNFNDPHVRYYRWFYSGPWNNNQPDDQMVIKLNNGNSTVTLENLTASANTWSQQVFRISDFIQPTATMRFIVEVSDLAASTIVEGGLDKFEVLEAQTLSIAELQDASIRVYPNPTAGVAMLAITAATTGTVQVVNALGQQVFVSDVQAGEQKILLETQQWPSGIYYVQMQNQQLLKTVKLMVRH